MGITLKVFFVEEGDHLRRVSLKRYERLYFSDEPELFPEYAGRKIRCALVTIENENRTPKTIRHIHYSYSSFDGE